MKLNPSNTALVVGSFVAFMHLVWSLAVALNFAQFWLDWVYSIHFLNNPFTVTGFNIATALMLLVVTFIVGYLMGWIFAYIWNYLQKK